MRRLSIAYDWQDVIIRAAITLKLSNFEETGGIIAAHTTSIPEAPSSGRTWDYRYCWLRDAYFVVKALNRLGATQTMEDFISFILGIASEEVIRPVYSIVPADPMDEKIRRRPQRLSRRRSGAHRQRRGWDKSSTTPMAASSSPRCRCSSTAGCRGRATPGCSICWNRLGIEAGELAFEPDAGIWEYRGRMRVHTHSAAMCWAGCNRLAAIAEHLGLKERAAHWTDMAEPHPVSAHRAGLEREARRLHGRFRHRRSRCQRAAAAGNRADRGQRSPFRAHRRCDRSVNFCATSTLCVMRRR